MSSFATKRSSLPPSLCGILVGDELGQLKRIDLNSGSKLITVVNSQFIDTDPSPSKSVSGICPFDNEVNNVLYLVTNKPNTLSLYNCLSNQWTQLKSPDVSGDVNVIGAQPIARSNVVICYDNGTIHMQNIEKEMLDSVETKKKAIKLLGLDLSDHSIDGSNKSIASTNSSKSSKLTKISDGSAKALTHPRPKPSQIANAVSVNAPSKTSSSSSSTCIFAPNWNTNTTSMTCFKVCNNRIAIGGHNIDLKVFDLTTKQSIFTAKSPKSDWLGLKTESWTSGLDWVGGNSLTNVPSPMVAVCSRTDSCVRIYDIRCKSRKPIMNINLKNETFNNDSNPPSFTSICSTTAPHSIAVPTQNLILGTTLGRMMAVDLRFNSHSYRTLGMFKGFGGGAIRDIKYIGQNNHSFKVISCSLDRFVRIHTLNTSSSSSRQIDSKFYVKTRPTCLQPICSTFVIAPMVGPNDIDDDDIDNIDIE